MADTKTDSSSTPLSDDPANSTKELSAKPNAASHPAGAEPALDTLFHRTSLRFCCAANVVTASEARELDAYRDCSNRLLDRTAISVILLVRSSGSQTRLRPPPRSRADRNPGGLASGRMVTTTLSPRERARAG